MEETLTGIAIRHIECLVRGSSDEYGAGAN